MINYFVICSNAKSSVQKPGFDRITHLLSISLVIKGIGSQPYCVNFIHQEQKSGESLRVMYDLEDPQSFVYRGNSHRRKSAACPKFDMVWLHRSPIPVGRRGVISSFKLFLPVVATGRGRGRGVGTLWRKRIPLRQSILRFTWGSGIVRMPILRRTDLRA